MRLLLCLCCIQNLVIGAAILKAELARKGVDYESLAAKLKEFGVEESYNSINTKINRGAFTFQFFIQCMKAIGG